MNQREIADSLEWCADWHNDMFAPAHDAKGWPVEMHGLVADHEELGRAYVELMEAAQGVKLDCPHFNHAPNFTLCPEERLRRLRAVYASASTDQYPNPKSGLGGG